MNELLITLDKWHAMEICFVASIGLILVDYFFKVDYPAYFAYLLCAVGVALAVPFELAGRSAVAAGVLALLLVLHKVWFTQFLTNAHDAREAT